MDDRLCGLYGRVSTARQAVIEDGGLDTQFALMDKTVEINRLKYGDINWDIVERYREEGRSGKDLDRPEFQRMMRDIESGRINTVIVHKIDRITRSLKDFFVLWETFEQHNVQFISLHENFDTTTAIGRAMLKLILVFAELEREQVSERTSATMQHRAEQGYWNGGRRLGYDIDPDDKGTLKVNAEAAQIVLEDIFLKYQEEQSANKVIQHLDRKGIRKPTYESRRGNKKGGGAYSKMEVLRVLTDPVYLGKIKYKDELFDGKHEAIIDADLFESVQQILARNRQTKGTYRDQRQHVFLLQKLIRCGKCGSFMTPKTSTARGGKKHFYYQCTLDSHSSGTECDAKYVPAEAAENYILDEIRKISASPDEIYRIVRMANEQKDERVERLERDRDAMRKTKNEVDGKIKTLVAKIEGGLESPALERRLAELEGESKDLLDQLATIMVERNQIIQESLSFQVMADTYRDFPTMLDAAIEAEDWYSVKDIVALHVEAIDWHQDAEDPATGTVQIMLFEEAHAGYGVEMGAEKNSNALPVNGGALERNGRLPRQDSNLRQGG